MESILLFNDYDLRSVLENQKPQIGKAVAEIPSQQLSTFEQEELVSQLKEKLQIAPIVLLEDEISVDQKEAKVDVRYDVRRFIRDRSRPVYVEGTKVIFYVPFTGEANLFKCRPNQYNLNPPRATTIKKNELIFEYDVPGGEDISQTKTAFERTLSDLRQWVGWVNVQIGQHNSEIEAPIRSQIAARKQILESSRQQITELGFKIRPKEEAAEKPVAPVVTKSKDQSIPKKPAAVRGRAVKERAMKKSVESSETFDVALSFAGEDRAYVEEVAQLLRTRGINVFYDNFNKATLWGRNLIDHLGRIYAERSRFIVMFISKHYAEKEWTNHERKFAQERAFKLQEDCILPARFDDTEISGLPSTIGYADLRKTTPEELVEMIAIKIMEGSEEDSPRYFTKPVVEQNPEESEDEDETDDNVLVSEFDTLKPDTHKIFTCVLEENESIEYEIESKRPVDIMVLDNEDYQAWKKLGEIDTYYEHFEEYLNLQETFTAPKDGKYLVVVVNYGEAKTKIQVDITRIAE